MTKTKLLKYGKSYANYIIFNTWAIKTMTVCLSHDRYTDGVNLHSSVS